MKLVTAIRKDLGLKIGIFSAISLAITLIAVLLVTEAVYQHQIPKHQSISLLVLLAIILPALSIYSTRVVIRMVLGRSLDRITKVLQQAEKGDLRARVESDSIDELGILSRRLNKMLQKVTELEKIKIHSDRKLVMAEEELKYKKALEEKTRIIEDTNARLQDSLREFSLLSRLSNTVSSVLDPHELYLVLAEMLPRELNLSEFALFITDSKKKNLVLAAQYGLSDTDDSEESKYKMDDGLLGEVSDRTGVMLLKNTNDRLDYINHYPFILPDRCALFLPILRKGRLLGVLYFSRDWRVGFGTSERDLLTTVASQVGVALENAMLYSQAKELTVTDDLTGIYNRRYFYQALTMEVKRSKRFKRPLSLLMLDVDHFKKFNDNFGHLVGDQVLKELCAVLSKNVREVDTLSRYGGEEFALILLDTDVENAYHAADKLRQIVEDYFKTSKIGDKTTGKISISIGVSGMPSDAVNIDDLINHADIALYSAKVKGRNQVVLFNKKVKPILKAI